MPIESDLLPIKLTKIPTFKYDACWEAVKHSELLAINQVRIAFGNNYLPSHNFLCRNMFLLAYINICKFICTALLWLRWGFRKCYQTMTCRRHVWHIWIRYVCLCVCHIWNRYEVYCWLKNIHREVICLTKANYLIEHFLLKWNFILLNSTKRTTKICTLSRF